MRKATRTRNWTIVVYPENFTPILQDIQKDESLFDAEIEWLQSRLNSMNIEYVISPRHDKDNNGAEEEKKAHYHVMLMFGGVKSYEQVEEVLKPLKNARAKLIQKVHSTKSLIRYFLHLDHPDKHQYKKSDLVAYGGVDINDLIRPSTSERYTMIAEMMDFVDDQGFTEFTQLLQYARKERREDWFPLLCDSSTYLLNTYIKSQRFQNRPEPD